MLLLQQKKKHQFPLTVASFFLSEYCSIRTISQSVSIEEKFDLGISSHGEQGPRKQVQRTEPVALSCTRMNTDRSGDKKGCLASCQFPGILLFFIYTTKMLDFCSSALKQGRERHQVSTAHTSTSSCALSLSFCLKMLALTSPPSYLVHDIFETLLQ